MSEPSETPFWIKFFIEAGIPPSISTEYAITFSDNRIKESMLMDLDKEHLKELGISVLGDIISILKYAKLFHSKKSRENLILNHGNVKQHVSKETVSNSKTNSVAVRMLEHYVRKELPTSKLVDHSRINLAVKRPIEEEESQISNKRNSVFRRLGDNFVSSTTQDTPKIIVTMLGKSDGRGGIDSPNSSRISKSLPDNTVQGDKGLEYQGIFKYSKKEIEGRKKANLQFQKTPNSSFTAGFLDALPSNIKHRIGTPVKSSKSEGIFAREFQNETTAKPKIKITLNNSGEKDTRIFMASGKKNSIKQASTSQLPNVHQTVLKKIVRVNKRTGQIIGNSRKVAHVFNRLNKPDKL